MTHFINEHIVICGWNERGERLVELLWNLRSQTEKADRSVVILSDEVKGLPDEPWFHDTLVIPISPLAPSALERAKVAFAEAVILLADHDAPNPDDDTMLVALRIQRSIVAAHKLWSSKAVNGRTAPSFPRWPNISAEVVNPNRRRHLMEAGVQEAVCSTDMMYRVVAQAMLTPMVLPVFRDLIRASADTNEVYLIDVPPVLYDKTFREAVAWFTEPDRRVAGVTALLVGFKRGQRLGSDDLPERPVRQQRRLCLNPRGDQLNQPLRSIDQLVVIDYGQAGIGVSGS